MPLTIEESIARIEEILKYIRWQRCLNKGGQCIIEYDAETHRNIEFIKEELRNIKDKAYRESKPTNRERQIYIPL